MRACMLQPRGGSDARADFAEQVAVLILDCRLVVGGVLVAPGPSAGRRPARSSPEAPLAARGASKDFVDTVLLGISNLCVLWL